MLLWGYSIGEYITLNSGVAVVLHSMRECDDSVRLGFEEEGNEKESLFV